MKIPFTDQEYDKMIASLFVRFPSFGSAGAVAYKPGLERMEDMLERLGNPHRKFRSIHVAGTNGKGSTCNMLTADFAASGLKTGLYTSPHILDFRERARIIETDRGRAGRGESQVTLIPRQAVWDFIQSHNDDIEELKLSFFEITTAMAFDWFAACKIDLAVIETGLGGRLDATNVIVPELSVITNIGYDHMDLLGPTLADIAGEKAGIIKPGVPVVIGESGPESDPVFLRRAASLSAPLTFADAGDFGLLAENFLTSLADATRCDSEGHKCPSGSGTPLPTGGGPPRSGGGVPAGALGVSSQSSGTDVEIGGSSTKTPLFVDEMGKIGGSSTKAPHFVDEMAAAGGIAEAIGLDLKGCYQEKNLNTVLTALEVLGREPDMAAISHAATICDFHGRWETVLHDPETICDIGHNQHGLKYNFKQLEDMLEDGSYTDLFMVYGSVSDKDVDAVLKILPAKAHIYFTAAANHRAMSAGELFRRAGRPNAEIGGSVSESVRKALDRCKELQAAAGRNATLAKPLLYIGGSTYVVSEAISYLETDRQ